MVVNHAHVEFTHRVGDLDILAGGLAGDILLAIAHSGAAGHGMPLRGGNRHISCIRRNLKSIGNALARRGVRITHQVEVQVFRMVRRMGQRSVGDFRRSGAIDVGQLCAAQLVASAGHLEDEHIPRFVGDIPVCVLLLMIAVHEGRFVVGEMEGAFVAAHQIRVLRLAEIAARCLVIDRHIGIVLQGEDEGVVAQAAAGGGIVDRRGRGHHHMLVAGEVFGHDLVRHQVLVAAVRGGRVVGDVHDNRLVGGDHRAADMACGRLRVGGEVIDLSPVQRDVDCGVGRAAVLVERLGRDDLHGGVVLGGYDLHAVAGLPAVGGVLVLVLHGDEELGPQGAVAFQGIDFAVIVLHGDIGVHLGRGVDIDAVVQGGVVGGAFEACQRRLGISNQLVGLGAVGGHREGGQRGIGGRF